MSNRRHDDRRGSAHQRGYTRSWQRARRLFLMQNPFCRMCEREHPPKITAAAVVDHIVAHRGDPELFWDPDNRQPLCKSHHDSEKQRIERLGYIPGCDSSGRPRDKSHPWNGGQPIRRWAYSIPHRIKPSAIPVHLVCGAPGSGKSTYAKQNAQPGDIVIDVDAIRVELGFPRYSTNPLHLKLALRERDRLLETLSTKASGEAWVIVMAPTDDERTQWVEALGNVKVHAIDTTAAECKRRIMTDPTREGHKARLMKAVDKYFRRRLAAQADTSQRSLPREERGLGAPS